MAMSRLAIAAAAAGASVSLLGCGSPAPGPTPDPYMADTVAAAWANHFEAFGEQDLDKIMLDYDAESVLQIFNDGCDINGGGLLTEFVGIAPIRMFFSDLFTTLTDTPDLVVPNFTAYDAMFANPTVEDGMMMGEMMSYDGASVFLVWSAVAQGITKATDTFLWKKTDQGVMVKKQNIVATEPGACPAMPPMNPAAPMPDANSPITMGWENHFASFGDQNKAGILADYTDASIVQIWSWGGADAMSYSRHSGLTEIGTMFDNLWASMNAQMFNGTNGLSVPEGFPRVEVDKKSVFLTWMSYSNPKATDTFFFDDAGKILRQTIVTSTGVAPMVSREVVV